MSNNQSGSKKSARERMEEEQARMRNTLAQLEEQEEKERLEAEKQRELAQIRKERAEKAALARRARAEEKKARSTPGSVMSAGSTWGTCTQCVTRKKECTWTDASQNSKGTQGEVLRSSNKRGRPDGTPSPKGKGKKRQKSPTPEADVEIVSIPGTVVGPEPAFLEYDDEAWVAAANSIVAELARTNGLLERSIQAAEGSRDAADRMSTGLAQFLEMQGQIFEHFQQNVMDGFRMMTEQIAVGGGDGADEADEGSGSAEKSGGGADGSGGDMEMDS
ncbi:hypothetical protein CY34DRAFT_15574 [Suillus luteus UH-Slu-Lm8-n1]|uniref:Uncharacterized protein n=1 Tax=Suillus luteus UH-Slu-Lm8-n1 TaxID=930992 RepID=A0A0D0A7M9_9AGAM|nr:hypothetical protein CY34DRAFT_15574 [Suillus luteus UH-Slu-Lm8-n1]